MSILRYLLLNKNSLINLIYFQTLKKWLFGTYSGSDMENIIIGENVLQIGV